MANVEPTSSLAQQADVARKSQEDAVRTERKRKENAREQLRKDAAQREANNLQAARVMEESRPTPTQEENDMAKLNALHPDDKIDPENPEMPPLHEQQARAAEASGGVPYKTRAAEPAKADKKP